MEAFIYDYSILQWLTAKNNLCELRLQKETLFQGTDGFATRKNLTWSATINEPILYFSEQGEVLRIYKRWFADICKDVSTTPKTVLLDINHFGRLIFILCVTTLACFPKLLPEHVYYKYFKNIVVGISQRVYQNQSIKARDSKEKGSDELKTENEE